MRKKRGLSPIIATVLLVSVTIVLATIIFFWARNFIGESISKDGQKIELLCDDVRFVAEAYSDTLFLENTGTIPIYGVEMRKKEVLGDVSGVGKFEGSYVAPGETKEIEGLPNGVEGGDNLFVVPLLLGTVDNGAGNKAHVCDEDYAQEITVG